MFDIIYSKAINPVSALTKLLGKKKARILFEAKVAEVVGKETAKKMKDDLLMKTLVSSYGNNTIKTWIINLLTATPIEDSETIGKFLDFLEKELDKATKELSKKFVIVKGKNEASTQVLGIIGETGKTVSIGSTFSKRPDETEVQFIKRAKDITIVMLRDELLKP